MNFPEEHGWYCLKTQPKRERIAAVSLNGIEGIEALYPQVRYQRQNSKGKRSILEPMFPNYLFARFSPRQHIRAVGYARGVAYVVKHGAELIPVPEAVIAEIASLAEDNILDLPIVPLKTGDNIRIIAGIFEGSEADVVRLVPGSERVKLLLELLGQPSEIELSLDQVERHYRHPLQSSKQEGV